MKDVIPMLGLIIAILALLKQNRQLTASVATSPGVNVGALQPIGLDDRIAAAWTKRRQNRNPGHEPAGEASPQPVPIGM